MSEEGFLKRWSRKKRTETPSPAADSESAERPPSNLPPPAGEGFRRVGEGSPSVPPPRSGGGQVGVTPPAGPSTAKEEEAIDPATLPPIESLGPDSDYTVFLRKGVPEGLKIAALRKAWMSDPFIRDFRSPAIDYGWDFTTPEYSLRAGDDVAKMVDEIFGARPAAAPVASVPPPAAVSDAPSGPPRTDLTLPQNEAAPASQETPKPAPAGEPTAPRRKHGGALPD